MPLETGFSVGDTIVSSGGGYYTIVDREPGNGYGGYRYRLTALGRSEALDGWWTCIGARKAVSVLDPSCNHIAWPHCICFNAE